MADRPESAGFSALFKRFGRRLSGRPEREGQDGAEPHDAGTSDQIARQALALMLNEAVTVLQGLGLPSRSGFYRRGPGAPAWEFLSSAMTPAERWAMVLDAPTGEGWRYATLPQLIRQEMPDEEAVRQAAELLEQGGACLSAADQAGLGGLEPAIKLAVAWADFQVARIVPIDRREPLKLYFPPEDHAPAVATGDAASKASRKASTSGAPKGSRARKPAASRAARTGRKSGGPA